MDSEDRIIYRILDAARTVHSTLGPGFVENIYSRALTLELKNLGLQVEREKAIKIWYGAALVGKHLLDLVVDQSVIIELKASRCLIPVHSEQMRSYLHASQYRLGLLLNFGAPELQWEIIRLSDTSSLDRTSLV